MELTRSRDAVWAAAGETGGQAPLTPLSRCIAYPCFCPSCIGMTFGADHDRKARSGSILSFGVDVMINQSDDACAKRTCWHARHGEGECEDKWLSKVCLHLLSFLALGWPRVKWSSVVIRRAGEVLDERPVARTGGGGGGGGIGEEKSVQAFHAAVVFAGS